MNPPQVFAAVASAFNVREDFATCATRTDRLSRARFAAWKILRDSKECYTLMEIGEMSKRDHGSVIHGLKRCADLMETDPHFAECYGRALASIYQPAA
jgi:chromosomal replication initiation ATPase DnaA